MTDPTPIPPIIATMPGLDPKIISRLREAFIAVEHEPTLADVRTALLISKFIVPDSEPFRMLKDRHDRVNAECESWP